MTFLHPLTEICICDTAGSGLPAFKFGASIKWILVPFFVTKLWI